MGHCPLVHPNNSVPTELRLTVDRSAKESQISNAATVATIIDHETSNDHQEPSVEVSSSFSFTQKRVLFTMGALLLHKIRIRSFVDPQQTNRPLVSPQSSLCMCTGRLLLGRPTPLYSLVAVSPDASWHHTTPLQSDFCLELGCSLPHGAHIEISSGYFYTAWWRIENSQLNEEI